MNFNIENGFDSVAVGIDEAGRGALVGPLVVGAAYFTNRNLENFGVNDSKKLSARKRDEIFAELINNQHIITSSQEISNEIIDRININEATKLAIINLMQEFPRETNFIIDGNILPKNQPNCHSIIKGDTKSISIAASSIIAKVTRDRIMDRLHEEFPQYGWNKNKGYPTKDHLFAIKKFGTTKYHRLSYNLGI